MTTDQQPPPAPAAAPAAPHPPAPGMWMPDFTTTPDLAAALVQALGELTDPVKDGKAIVKTTTTTYGYTYLELPDLLDAARPVLARNGLCVLQIPRVIQNGVAIRSIVLHRSGQTFSPPALELQCSTRSPQDVGSAITYGRRYALGALLALAGSEDNDGADVPAAPRESRPNQQGQRQQPRGAQQRPTQQQQPTQPAQDPQGPAQASQPAAQPAQTPAQPAQGGREPSYSPNAPMTDNQRKRLYAQMREAGVPKEDQRRAISALLAAEAVGAKYDDDHPLTQANAGRVLDAIDRGQLDLWIRGEPLEPPY